MPPGMGEMPPNDGAQSTGNDAQGGSGTAPGGGMPDQEPPSIPLILDGGLLPEAPPEPAPQEQPSGEHLDWRGSGGGAPDGSGGRIQKLLGWASGEQKPEDEE